jgi:predicted DNA-binding protein YlxM (UPF0122 family)
MKEIADECNVSNTTISEWISKHGIDKRTNRETQLLNSPLSNDEWVKEQYCQEKRSMRDIADEVGVTPSGVKKALDRIGVETRGANDHQRKSPASHYFGSKGYEHVTAKHNYKRYSVYVHQLVVIADGANPSKVFSNGRYHVHHKNGVKWDNRPENLELQSSKDHMVNHHHDAKHTTPDEWASDSHKNEVLFELSSLVNDWRESDNTALEMAADELDGTLSEL